MLNVDRCQAGTLKQDDGVPVVHPCCLVIQAVGTDFKSDAIFPVWVGDGVRINSYICICKVPIAASRIFLQGFGRVGVRNFLVVQIAGFD